MTEGWRGAGKRPDWDRDPFGELRAGSTHDWAHDRKTGGSGTRPYARRGDDEGAGRGFGGAYS